MGWPTCTSIFILSRPPWAFTASVIASSRRGLCWTSSAITVIFICSITRSLRRRFAGLEGLAKLFSSYKVRNPQDLRREPRNYFNCEINLTLGDSNGTLAK